MPLLIGSYKCTMTILVVYLVCALPFMFCQCHFAVYSNSHNFFGKGHLSTLGASRDEKSPKVER